MSHNEESAYSEGYDAELVQQVSDLKETINILISQIQML